MPKVKGLRERLQNGETIIHGGGCHRELEKRGYTGLSRKVPDVIIDNPDVLELVHRDMVHNGSDVVQAYTSYTHRLHLRNLGLEEKTERLNRAALKLGRLVANDTGVLLAGSLFSLHIYDPEDPSTSEQTRAIFKEQIEFAVQEGADFIIGESFTDFGEAKLALESIQKFGNGLPSVITLTIHCPDQTTDGVAVSEALTALGKMGADVVGLNCARGPNTMLPLIREVTKNYKGPLAVSPAPFRTTEKEKTWMTLTDPMSGKSVYPSDVDMALCNRKDITKFGKEAKDLGIRYIGLCCGTNPSYIREIAEACGKKPKASAFGPNIKQTIMHNPNPTPYQIKKRQIQLGTWKPTV